MERMDYWLSNDHQKAKRITKICAKTIGGFAIFAYRQCLPLWHSNAMSSKP